MANDRKTKAATSGDNETKIFNVTQQEDFVYKRDRAQKMTFAKMQELLQRNPSRNVNKTFTQYTKELVKTYIQSPAANQNTLREISRFLWRNSMLYQRMIMYQASMPLFTYNITQQNDFSKDIDIDKSLKSYYKVVSEFYKFDIKTEGFNALTFALRDGFFVGFMYEADKRFLMALDAQYVRIIGKNSFGQWVVYFNAAFFDVGNNSEFVLGVDGNPELATWDQVFIDGYKKYKTDRNYQWFRLDPERTCVVLSCPDDEFSYPLPAYLPLFTSLMDLLDLEAILQNRNELENYKLIVSQIPLVDNGNSGDVDDFAISLELSNYFTDMIQSSVPSAVSAVSSPMKIDTITFDKSNGSGSTDELGQAIRNLFNNSGVSEVVVAGGGSNPSTLAIKYSQIADANNTWIMVNRFESWLDYYLNTRISNGFIFEIFKMTDFNKDEFIQEKKDIATLGGSAMDFISAVDGSPYRAINKLRFESALGIRDLMIPLQSSYNTSNSEVGRPKVKDDELSPSADRTRNTAE